jgi:hypothetical protein
MSKKEDRAVSYGTKAADTVMEAAHLTYNAFRGQKMVRACIARLKQRLPEIQPKKATPTYRKARYKS